MARRSYAASKRSYYLFSSALDALKPQGHTATTGKERMPLRPNFQIHIYTSILSTNATALIACSLINFDGSCFVSAFRTNRTVST